MDSKEKCLTVEKTDKEAPLLVLRYAPWLIILMLSVLFGFLAMHVWFSATVSSVSGSSNALIFLWWLLIMIKLHKVWFMDSLKLYRDRIEKTCRFGGKPKSFFFENSSIAIATGFGGKVICVTSDNNRLGKPVESRIYYFYFSRDKDIDMENFINRCKSVGVEVKEAPPDSGTTTEKERSKIIDIISNIIWFCIGVITMDILFNRSRAINAIIEVMRGWMG